MVKLVLLSAAEDGEKGEKGAACEGQGRRLRRLVDIQEPDVIGAATRSVVETADHGGDRGVGTDFSV